VSTLFITDRWPAPLQDFRHGIALRMRLLLRGLQRADDTLHLLLFSPLVTPWNSTCEAELRQSFNDLWGIRVGEIRALVAKVNITPQTSKLWPDYLRPALSMYHQARHQRISSPAHVDALRRAMAELCPERVFVQRLTSMSLLRRAGVIPAYWWLPGAADQRYDRVWRPQSTTPLRFSDDSFYRFREGTGTNTVSYAMKRQLAWRYVSKRAR
jgi:hypothetical protein